MAVNWNYYDKFESINEKYLPLEYDGNTKATQIVTVLNKLVYKWYNDGDVFDNTYHLVGGANDLSDYANWLDKNVEVAKEILNKISDCSNDSDYEDLLKELADKLLDEEFLAEQNKVEKVNTVYDCNGRFQFVELDDEDDYYEDDYYYDEEDEDDEE